MTLFWFRRHHRFEFITGGCTTLYWRLILNSKRLLLLGLNLGISSEELLLEILDKLLLLSRITKLLYVLFLGEEVLEKALYLLFILLLLCKGTLGNPQSLHALLPVGHASLQRFLISVGSLCFDRGHFTLGWYYL